MNFDKPEMAWKTKEAFRKYILDECERQWNENQAEEYGPWEDQGDDTRADYYNNMYKTKLEEARDD